MRTYHKDPKKQRFALSGNHLAMKYTVILLLSVLTAIFGSCKKENKTTFIEGTWKLVKVTDRNTQSIINPSSNNNPPFVFRVEGYKFSGNTFRNNFSLGSFDLMNNEIRFGTYSRSELNEDNWGKAFFEVLNSCIIQSRFPCSPVYVEIKQDSMIWAQNITPYELRFIRFN